MTKAELRSNPSEVPVNAAAFERWESNVRSYCRSFPTVFVRAKGALQWDEQGREYIDFFCGAGALNYGHNPDFIQRALVAYVQSDGVLHALDMHTAAKRSFLEALAGVILEPRGLDYRVQFCGPTGANAVEAALKLARLVTGRTNVYGFSGGYHGLSLGGLAVTANRYHREAAGVPLVYGGSLPFPDGPFPFPGSLEYITHLFEDPSSGTDLPAAIILETTQCEGGIYSAPDEWLRGLRALCDRHQILLICDDIQAGCGRTGTFFSFERAGIEPDMVALSKSISGSGLPMSLLLMKRSLDVWQPAQHTGTFRGNQLAFVAGTAALEQWRTDAFADGIAERGRIVQQFLREMLVPLLPSASVRGHGLLFGLDLTAYAPEIARSVARTCFEKGLLIELCGRDDRILKLLPPLNIEVGVLERGLDILLSACREHAPRSR